MHRAPLNELRPVHHEAVFGAPGLSRTREGGFRYRISILYRKRLFFTPNASKNASRTGGSLFEHGAHIPYRRRPSPVPNSANARKEESIACTECFKRQKGERYCLHRIYQTARKEKGMARNMTRNAAASKKITASVPKTQTPSITSLSPQLHTQPPASTVTSPATTATHPATHSANKKHHQYKTPPASTVTPPRLSEKSASQSAIGLLGHSGRGRTNRRGTFRTGSPTGTKKEVPTECYFNRDFRKAAAAYSPTWWGSTIGASELNFSVRYGKRWILTAITAAVCYLREISRLKSWLTQKISGY